MQGFLDAVVGIANESGFMGLFENPGYIVMILIACVLIYLAIAKQFEPLLLLPIAFGMLLANLPFGGIIHMEFFLTESGHPDFMRVLNEGGLADMLYLGVKLGIYPPLIFLGIGTMTDFGPLISN
ncbi:MAG: sodium ion-translocating decarboxylase subunit beta, partial [Oscillospiraceae bacterium]